MNMRMRSERRIAIIKGDEAVKSSAEKRKGLWERLFRKKKRETAESASVNALTETLWWTLKDGILTIGGTGRMPDRVAPWFGKSSEIRKAAVLDGVNHIGKAAFKDCMNLIEVTLPNDLTEIGQSAFENCVRLCHISLPEGLKTIRYAAFQNTGIRQILLPKQLETIEFCAFKNTPLEELILPESTVNAFDIGLSDRCKVRYPKGLEDMPIFRPITEQDYLRHYAYAFFNKRRDVLEQPTGNPAEDRFTALSRLLQCISDYLGVPSEINFKESYAQSGIMRAWNRVYYVETDNCYDGGCGPDYDIVREGVIITILSEAKFKEKCAQMELVRKKPFAVWKSADGNTCLLERPMGLSDRFSVVGEEQKLTVLPEVREAPADEDLPLPQRCCVNDPNDLPGIQLAGEVFFRDIDRVLMRQTNDTKGDRFDAMQQLNSRRMLRNTAGSRRHILKFPRKKESWNTVTAWKPKHAMTAAATAIGLLIFSCCMCVSFRIGNSTRNG